MSIPNAKHTFNGARCELCPGGWCVFTDPALIPSGIGAPDYLRRLRAAQGWPADISTKEAP